MSNIGVRIKLVRAKLSMTQSDFADRIGIKRNSISLIESEDRNTSEPVIRAICREFGVNYDWLKTGEGEMYESNSAATLAELDDLMAGEEHPETRALVRALAGMSNAELDVIDALVARIRKELGD